KLAAEDRPDRRRTLAIALARLGRPDPLAEFMAAPRLREDPLEKAEELAVLGRAEEAKQLLDEIAADNPGNGIALYNVGCVLAQIGDEKRAIEMLEAALSKR